MRKKIEACAITCYKEGAAPRLVDAKIVHDTTRLKVAAKIKGSHGRVYPYRKAMIINIMGPVALM